MAKILSAGDRICLFCEKSEELFYDEYTPYHECRCKDAVRDRQISEDIRKLDRTRPKPKFEIQERSVLYKKEKV